MQQQDEDTPPAEQGEMTTLDYFGAIAPQDAQVLWYGRLLTVRFRLTDGADEADLYTAIRPLAGKEERALAEAQYRMARAVQAVAGQEVRFGSFEDRLAWVRRWPMPLLDAVLAAYETVAFAPIRLLEGMEADPSIEAGPAATGSSGG